MYAVGIKRDETGGCSAAVAIGMHLVQLLAAYNPSCSQGFSMRDYLQTMKLDGRSEGTRLRWISG